MASRLDRVADLVLEARISVDDVPAGHVVTCSIIIVRTPPLARGRAERANRRGRGGIGRSRRKHASTPKKKIAEQRGHDQHHDRGGDGFLARRPTTLAVSARTWRMNSPGEVFATWLDTLSRKEKELRGSPFTGRRGWTALSAGGRLFKVAARFVHSYARATALRRAQDRSRGIAQLVEHRSPKPRAVGSSPSAPANSAARLIAEQKRDPRFREDDDKGD